MSARRGFLIAILANELRGLVMTAPAWVVLWHQWVRH